MGGPSWPPSSIRRFGDQIDTQHATLLECGLRLSFVFIPGSFRSYEELAMTLVKIIVITVLIILSILLFGRFFI